MMSDISNLRVEYDKSKLDSLGCDKNPLILFNTWFAEAIEGQVLEPNAMVLSTVQGNRPRSRVVLLKGIEEDNFIFYTNYLSHKGTELETNPNASLVFFWASLERQVRIEGVVHKISAEKSEKYFQSRPRGSKLGALVSNQSEELQSREILEKKLQALELQYPDDNIPMPEHWGGYALNADFFEFWQGRRNRLHDRVYYKKLSNNKWEIGLLSP